MQQDYEEPADDVLVPVPPVRAFSNGQVRQINVVVTNALAEPRHYLSLPPNERVHEELVSHLAKTNELLKAVLDRKPHLPHISHTQLLLQIRGVIEPLEVLLANFEAIAAGGPAREKVGWETLPSGVGGRRLAIPDDMLCFYVDGGLKDHQIADVFGCRRETIGIRRRALGRKKKDRCDMTAEEIASVILVVLDHGSGNEGEKAIWAGLKIRGINCSRDQAREATTLIARPEAPSRRQALVRRIYRVPFINSLWHIDGHHKLIRYSIVQHGGIDGFSRTVVFLRASDNNRAATVLEAFMDGTRRHGVPSRVRGDHGKENWDVKRFMETTRGLDRGSFIQGPSTHNQRIERLWVDLQRWCTSRYKDAFEQLEAEGQLDVNDPLDMYALHFCYLPMLNRALEVFVDTWNNHGIRTAGNKTPNQMWLENMLAAAKAGLDPVGVLDEDDLGDDEADGFVPHARLDFAEYGVDREGRRDAATHDDDPYVDVPPILGRWPALQEIVTLPDVRNQLVECAGDYWPPGPDTGKGRYLRTRRFMKDLVEYVD